MRISKKKLLGIAAGLALTALSLNPSTAETKIDKHAKGIDAKKSRSVRGGKRADGSRYLGIDFITDMKQVEVDLSKDYGYVRINYPNEEIPYFRISYEDNNGDSIVDEYTITAFYNRSPVCTSGVTITFMSSKDDYLKKFGPYTIVEYMDDDLQERVNKDYKELIKKYGQQR